MSDFKAKMYQIQFWLGLRPRPRWGSLQRSPDPLAGLRGPTSKGRGGDGKGRGWGRNRGDVKGRGSLGEGRGGDETPPLHAPNPYFWIRPCNEWTRGRLDRQRPAGKLYATDGHGLTSGSQVTQNVPYHPRFPVSHWARGFFIVTLSTHVPKIRVLTCLL